MNPTENSGPTNRHASIGARWRIAGGLALAIGLMAASGLAFASSPDQVVETVGLAPARAGTAHQHLCGPPGLSTPGTTCQGFAGREVIELPDLWVVGYESSRDLQEKHVYQTVAAFDLGALPNMPGATLSRAALNYLEASTTHRSAAGDSEYGVLPTCNTRLGVADNWDGSLERLAQSRPAATAGVMGAMTAGPGSWDVTPQVQQWLSSGAGQRVFVLGSEDESMDIREQAMCLSYIFSLELSVEYAMEESGM